MLSCAHAPHSPKVSTTPPKKPYATQARQIIDASLSTDGAWRKLEYLTDRIGHRLSGSQPLEQAINWAEAALRADGHEMVHREPVNVPHWVRGEESAELLAPGVRRPLALLALGGSIGTPKEGITAEVVVVNSFEELDTLGSAKVAGKIVLINRAMPPFGPKGAGYGETVVIRWEGPSRASKLGAVAVLIRSVTARSLRSPHTGSTAYAPNSPKIPAAALSVEDTMLLARLAKNGEAPKVRLVLGAEQLPDAQSANVMAELRGREQPDEIVLLGAHLDSWDVGQGAHDDGAGCVMAMQAVTVLRELGLRPRRTIRVVLFTNEENGLKGAKSYAETHKSEKHVFAIEADSGGFDPQGFDVEASASVQAQIAEVAKLLNPIGATKVEAGDAGADVSTLKAQGVPLLGLHTDGSIYFDYHHSQADTLDKVDPKSLQRGVAALAVMAYVLADL